MIRRMMIIVAPVIVLTVLIFYSQYRPEPQRVSGFVEADEIRLGSRVGGRVRSVLVHEGQRVERGQVLVELEPYDLLEQQRQAESTLASLDANYQRLSAGYRPEEIAQAKARLEQFRARLALLESGPRVQEIEAARSRRAVAEAEVKLAQKNFDRTSGLYQQSAVSRAEFEAVSERLEAAQANLTVRSEEAELLELGSREEEIREASARVDEALQGWQLAKNGYRQEEITAAKASRDAAAANVRAIDQQIKELQIRSPVNGTVEALELQSGDLVPAGAPVLSVMDDTRLWVRAYVPQNQTSLRVGQPLWVTVDSFGGRRFRGKITFIARQAEFTPNNVQTPEERAKQVFRIKVEIETETDQLRPGMTADVHLESGHESR